MCNMQCDVKSARVPSSQKDVFSESVVGKTGRHVFPWFYHSTSTIHIDIRYMRIYIYIYIHTCTDIRVE